VRLAPDGRIFVAEKGGVIKVFDGFGDPTPDVYADLSRQVHDSEMARDRGVAIRPGAKRPKPQTSRGGRLRRTRRATHRGTRWLSAFRSRTITRGPSHPTSGRSASTRRLSRS
jgi:hypothetical protein